MALVSELAKIARVTVVAPDRERSAAGHSLTFYNPLRVQRIRDDQQVRIYACDGTPTDCVLLGLYELCLHDKPDLVVSGINRGANLGDDITYSGTVSVAMEGLIHGYPSFAVSLACQGIVAPHPLPTLHWHHAAEFARRLARLVVKHGLPPKTFLNVNVPNLSASEVTGVEVTRQGVTRYDQRLVKRQDPRGVEYYWITGAQPTGDPVPGTDFGAIHQHRISVTPMQINLTDQASLESFHAWQFHEREATV
jgi:5'-nucleotidase